MKLNFTKRNTCYNELKNIKKVFGRTTQIPLTKANILRYVKEEFRSTDTRYWVGRTLYVLLVWHFNNEELSDKFYNKIKFYGTSALHIDTQWKYFKKLLREIK